MYTHIHIHPVTYTCTFYDYIKNNSFSINDNIVHFI